MIATLFETVLPVLLTCSAIVIIWAAYDLWHEIRAVTRHNPCCDRCARRAKRE